MKKIIAIIYILTLVSTKSLETGIPIDDDTKLEILVYLPASDEDSSAEIVYDEDNAEVQFNNNHGDEGKGDISMATKRNENEQQLEENEDIIEEIRLYNKHVASHLIEERRNIRDMLQKKVDSSEMLKEKGDVIKRFKKRNRKGRYRPSFSNSVERSTDINYYTTREVEIEDHRHKSPQRGDLRGAIRDNKDAKHVDNRTAADKDFWPTLQWVWSLWGRPKKHEGNGRKEIKIPFSNMPLRQLEKQGFADPSIFDNAWNKQDLDKRKSSLKVLVYIIDGDNIILDKLANFKTNNKETTHSLGDDDIFNSNIVIKKQEKINANKIRASRRAYSCYADFVTDFLTEMLELNDDHFKKSFYWLLYGIKTINLADILDEDVGKRLVARVDYASRQDMTYRRMVIQAIKSLIVRRSLPTYLVNFDDFGLNYDPKKTEAAIEIINTLNEKVPLTHFYRTLWDKLINHVKKFAVDPRAVIKPTMIRFVELVRNTITRLDETTKAHVLINIQFLITSTKRNKTRRLPESESSTEKEEDITRKQNSKRKSLQRKKRELLTHILHQIRLDLNSIGGGVAHSNHDASDVNNDFDVNVQKDKSLCPERGICRTRNGFVNFLRDVLVSWRGIDQDYLFLFVSEIMAKVLKVTDFSVYLDHPSDMCIRKFSLAPVKPKREMVDYLISVIDKRDEPILDITNAHKTFFALSNLVITLDEIIEDSDVNIKSWNDIRSHLNAIGEGTLNYESVEPTIVVFVENIKYNLGRLDATSKRKLLQNVWAACQSSDPYKFVTLEIIRPPLNQYK